MIVLTIVPLSSLAGIYGLKIMNIFSYEPLNMLSMLGFIILLGIVVNNSILIVYKSLNNIREGLSPIDSVKFAVQKRIRPIFMTTLSTSFGLLPLAIIPGAGAELYRGLAVIILSGLLISTFSHFFNANGYYYSKSVFQDKIKSYSSSKAVAILPTIQSETE